MTQPKAFMDAEFLLESPSAVRLFQEYAKDQPILDYHCHLSPQWIFENHRFENLTQAWLAHDHYKWRAMRTLGVEESYCTGERSDWEKFEKWAATVPHTVRNPLYHWTHLELRRYFGIQEILNPQTAREIFEKANAQLAGPGFQVRDLLKRMRVRVVCTTDDPTDELTYHRLFREMDPALKMLPTFRPDRALQFSDPLQWRPYAQRLQQTSGIEIRSLDSYLDALRQRHDFFESLGCVSSDHGLEKLPALPSAEGERQKAFDRVLMGQTLTEGQILLLQSHLLWEMARWDHEKGWVQQFHLGALRNNNSRQAARLGPDSGWDSVGEKIDARSIARFLDTLDREERLAKTILYNLNPAHNAILATMAGNFNDGSLRGKIQWGAAWWFLDQLDGMTQQINTLSQMGLISCFVGMLTDSRSFLSFPRHEYFRRLLCNLFGGEIDRGLLPQDLPAIGKLVSDICYTNARHYFKWPTDVEQLLG